MIQQKRVEKDNLKFLTKKSWTNCCLQSRSEGMVHYLHVCPWRLASLRTFQPFQQKNLGVLSRSLSLSVCAKRSGILGFSFFAWLTTSSVLCPLWRTLHSFRSWSAARLVSQSSALSWIGQRIGGRMSIHAYSMTDLTELLRTSVTWYSFLGLWLCSFGSASVSFGSNIHTNLVLLWQLLLLCGSAWFFGWVSHQFLI